MVQTSNLRTGAPEKMKTPQDILEKYPLEEELSEFIANSRKEIREVLHGQNKRLMVVVGPCSIHDPEAALDYARRLADLKKKVEDELLIVMRVYFEKPRTTVGWKGLINDPDIDGSCNISKGLEIARDLFLKINKLGLPIATEMLDPISPQYLSDLISWGAIGARTTESQPHREMASGLSFPVGFKNGTDGNIQIAIDAIKTASSPHRFLGIDMEGHSSIIPTTGNKNCHVVLRGGNGEPNYQGKHIIEVEKTLQKNKLPQRIMIDCSHGNSQKDHLKQEGVLQNVVWQKAGGNESIFAVMIESFLEAGSQKVPTNKEEKEKLKYGQSITDKCIDWQTTERILIQTAQALKECFGVQEKMIA